MIHLVLGRQGSGKTLFLVRTAYQMFRNKKKIYSNIHLNFPYNTMVYQEIIDCKYSDCGTFIDEIHQLLPARLSLRKINQEICDNFLSMARKQENEVYGSTQTERKVDVRFRDEADYKYYCTKYSYDSVSERWNEVLHNFALGKEVPIIIHMEVEEVYSGNFINTFFSGNQYFTKFDTKQLIRIRGLEKVR